MLFNFVQSRNPACGNSRKNSVPALKGNCLGELPIRSGAGALTKTSAFFPVIGKLPDEIGESGPIVDRK